jgi:hypothetical protein
LSPGITGTRITAAHRGKICAIMHGGCGDNLVPPHPRIEDDAGAKDHEHWQTHRPLNQVLTALVAVTMNQFSNEPMSQTFSTFSY